MRLQNIISTTYPLIEDKLIGPPLQLNSRRAKMSALQMEQLFEIGSRDYTVQIFAPRTKEYYKNYTDNIASLTTMALENKTPELALLGYVYLRDWHDHFRNAADEKKFGPVFDKHEKQIEKFVLSLTGEKDFMLQKQFLFARERTEEILHTEITSEYLSQAAEEILGSNAHDRFRKPSGSGLSPVRV